MIPVISVMTADDADAAAAAADDDDDDDDGVIKHDNDVTGSSWHQRTEGRQRQQWPTWRRRTNGLYNKTILIITWTFYMLCLLNVIGIKRNIILQVHSGLLEVFFFSNRVVNRLNMLDQQIVGAASVNAFKNGLAKLRKTKMGFFID